MLFFRYNHFFLLILIIFTLPIKAAAVDNEQIGYILTQMQNSIQTLNPEKIQDFMDFYLADDFIFTKQSVIIPFKQGDKAEVLEFKKNDYINYLNTVLYKVSRYRINITVNDVEFDKYENAIVKFSIKEELAIKIPKKVPFEPDKFFDFSILTNCLASIAGYDSPQIHAMNCAEKIILE